jgi:5-methylcytosine-specific restriction endonuclease McrA
VRRVVGKLQTLRPRIPSLKPRELALQITGTPRLRGRAWVDRRARWMQANPLCIDCQAEGRVTAAQELDHVVPLWQGGADDESNYASRCIEHHQAKTAREAQARAKGWAPPQG